MTDFEQEARAEAKKKIYIGPRLGQAKPTDATLLVNGPYPAARLGTACCEGRSTKEEEMDND